MTQEENASSTGTILLTFMAGVAIGAVIAALVTPKTGPEVRGDLKEAADRARRRAAELAKDASAVMDDLKERSRLAAADFKRGVKESVTHLKQPARPGSPEAAGQKGAVAGLPGWDGHDGG